MTTKYIAKLDGQIVGNRTTKDRTYTHAIVINGHSKTNHVVTWCGRLDLAQGEQRKYARYGYRAEIVPAEIVLTARQKAQALNAPSNAALAEAFNDSGVFAPFTCVGKD